MKSTEEILNKKKQLSPSKKYRKQKHHRTGTPLKNKPHGRHTHNILWTWTPFFWAKIVETSIYSVGYQFCILYVRKSFVQYGCAFALVWMWLWTKLMIGMVFCYQFDRESKFTHFFCSYCSLLLATKLSSLCCHCLLAIFLLTVYNTLCAMWYMYYVHGSMVENFFRVKKQEENKNTKSKKSKQNNKRYRKSIDF